jgi:hypothetical protein
MCSNVTIVNKTGRNQSRKRTQFSNLQPQQPSHPTKYDTMAKLHINHHPNTHTGWKSTLLTSLGLSLFCFGLACLAFSGTGLVTISRRNPHLRHPPDLPLLKNPDSSFINSFLLGLKPVRSLSFTFSLHPWPNCPALWPKLLPPVHTFCALSLR